MSYLKDREIWLSKVPTGNPPAGFFWKFIQNGKVVVRDSSGNEQMMIATNGNQAITGSLIVTGGITGTISSASYVQYSNVANKPTLVSGSGQISFNGITNKPTLVSGSSQVTYSGLTGIPSGIVSGSAQVAQFGYATTGANGFNGSQSITGSLTVTGQVIAQTLNVQQVTSSIVFSSGSNVFGNNTGNTHRFTGSVNITGSLSVNGAGTFTSTLAATNGTFINGSNQNTLGGGALGLLAYTGYNSSANQSITLGLALDEAVDSSIAYQYNLGVSGNATGQNLILTSKRRGTTDLTVLTINGTGGAVTLTGALNGTSGAFSGNIESTSLTASIVAGRTTGYGYFGNLTGGAYSIVYGDSHATKPNRIEISGAGGVYVLNAATFSSSVTANSTINGYLGTIAAGQTPATSGTTPVNPMLNLTNNRGIGMYFGGSYAGNYAQWIQVSDTGNLGVNYPLLLNPNGGNVGIGTASPVGKLMLYQSVAGNVLLNIVSNQGGSTQAGINFSPSITDVDIASNPPQASIYATDSNYGANIIFANKLEGAIGNALTERMRITSGGTIRITNFTSNGLVGTDSSGNLGVVNTNYTEIATGTITYSMNSGSPWGINNSFPATIRDYNDDGMAGSAGVATSSNLGRGVTFDLGSAKAVRRIVERGYPTKNLNIIVVQYSTNNSTWTDIHAYYHVYGNTQKDMQFNPTGAISARYWRWFIHDWTEREVQNYYTYEAIIYT